MLSVSDAIDAVLSETVPTAIEQIRLSQSAGRIAAADVFTPHDSPLFDKSLMDGFAVSSAGFAGCDQEACRTLPVVATITAGMSVPDQVTRETAVRIMTGAILPVGADCVVPIERTEFEEQKPDSVCIPCSAVTPEACILRRGASAAAGSRLLTRGARITAQQLAAMAEFGLDHVPVRRQPTIAVLATGNELVEGTQPLAPGQIRNSNEPMLVAQIQQSGANAHPLGIARDDATVLAERIGAGLQADMLLLTGGVSAGILDLVPAQLTAAGVRRVFHGIQLKPGKPLWFGVRETDNHRCLVFGLPGNPVSSMVCFELFVRPAIRRMRDEMQPRPVAWTARLSQPTRVSGNRPVYHPVRVSLGKDGLSAAVIPWSGSSDLRATVEANAMALLQPEHGQYEAGESVSVYFWTDLPFAENLENNQLPP